MTNREQFLRALSPESYVTPPFGVPAPVDLRFDVEACNCDQALYLEAHVADLQAKLAAAVAAAYRYRDQRDAALARIEVVKAARTFLGPP